MVAFFELDEDSFFGRVQPCARMHGLVSGVQTRVQLAMTFLARCLCAAHKHAASIVTPNLSLLTVDLFHFYNFRQLAFLWAGEVWRDPVTSSLPSGGRA